jgi:hypothetical protein
MEWTRIVAVVYENGQIVFNGRGSNAPLFEICDGPRHGTRGTDAQLFDLVGPIRWDCSTVSVYKTGEYRPA